MGLLFGAWTTSLCLVAVSAFAVELPSTIRYGLTAVACFVLIGGELFGRSLPLPQNHRQIPRHIATQDYRYGPLKFGFEMGTGVRTYLPSSVPHSAAVCLALLGSGDVTAAACLGAGFAAGRALLAHALVRQDASVAWWAALTTRARLVGTLCALSASTCIAGLVITNI